MAKQSAQELVKELFNKVQGIKLNDAAAIFGTTSRESILQDLRKSVAQLSAEVASKKPYEEIMKQYEVMAAAVDTAGVTGLISEAELPGYYKVIDDIWATIEKENK